MIDVHTHVLPGIDDGARTLLDSIEIIKDLISQGVTDVIATPHYISETNFVSTRKHNLELLEELKKALNDAGIKVNVYLGNEIYINNHIIELVKAGIISSLADSKYLLIELPMDDEYPDYEDILADVISHGYKAVLAHPERYMILQDDFDAVERLFDTGVLFQCNLGSVTGKYGKSAKKLVHKMMKERMIFAFGSDVHHYGRSDYFGKAFKKLSKYYNERELSKVLVTNAGRMLAK